MKALALAISLAIAAAMTIATVAIGAALLGLAVNVFRGVTGL